MRQTPGKSDQVRILREQSLSLRRILHASESEKYEEIVKGG
jgi:hypothetical protein